MTKRTLARKIMLSILAGAVLLGNSVAWAAEGSVETYACGHADCTICGNASVDGNNNVLIGTGVVRKTENVANAIIIGSAKGNSKTSGDVNSVAIGMGAIADDSAVAIGSDVNGSSNTVVLGSYSSANRENSIAVGNTAVADAANSIAMGWAAYSYAEFSIALGRWATTNVDHKYSVALGAGSKTNGSKQVSIGGLLPDENETPFTRDLVGLSFIDDIYKTDESDTSKYIYDEYAVSVKTLRTALTNYENTQGSGSEIVDLSDYKGISRVEWTDKEGLDTDNFYTKVSDDFVVDTAIGDGRFTIGYIYDPKTQINNEMLFAENKNGDTTILMNAQNGNIETQGSLSVGNGAFVVNAYDDANTGAKAGDVSMSGSLAVSGNAKIEGVLNVGKDIQAVGDVVASAGSKDVSLLSTAQQVATNVDDIEKLKNSLSGENGIFNRIDANENDIEQNKRDIEALDIRVTTNENAIADNKAAIVKNAQDIATVNTNLVTAIDTINGSIKIVNDNLVAAIDTINGGIGTEVEERKAADVVLQNNIDSEKTAREEADKKLQDNIATETEERQKADADLQEQITNIGSGSSEAINGLNQRINKLGTRLNKVGAGAAALAALHPLDFDPDDKLSFSAGVGNYAGENAAALGMFYRPNEKVMLSMGGTMGNGEEMVNMGISFALDKTNNVSNSRVAMAKEINALREHVVKQDEQIAQLVMLVNQLAGNAPQQKAVPVFAKEGRIRVERLSDGYEEYDRVKVVNHKEYGDKAVKAAPQKAFN